MSYQKFTKDIGMLSIVNLLTALKGLIILPLITKLLGAESYGIWTQIIVTISLVTPIAILGLPYTLIRYLAAEKNKKEIQEGVYSVFVLILAICLIITIFLFIFSKPIAKFFEGEQILVQILALTIIFECLNWVFLNFFRAFQKMGEYSLFVLLQVFGEVGLIISGVLLGQGLFGAVLALLVVRAFSFLLMGTVIVKRIGIKIPNFSKIREYLSFGLPTVPGNISYWIVSSSDKYLIAFFWGALFVGYYAPAYSIGGIIVFFITPLLLVLPAVLSKFFDENKIEEVKIYLRYSLKYFLMIAIPAVCGLSILSKQLLIIFSTKEIAEQSYLVVPWAALSLLLFGVYAIVVQIISLFKKTKAVAVIWTMAAFLNLGMNIILIPKLGILGAAITTLSSYILALGSTCYYSFKFLKFEIEWISILKIIIASIIMSVFVFSAQPARLLEILTVIAAAALLYGVLIFLLKGFSKKEIAFFKNFFYFLYSGK